MNNSFFSFIFVLMLLFVLASCAGRTANHQLEAQKTSEPINGGLTVDLSQEEGSDQRPGVEVDEHLNNGGNFGPVVDGAINESPGEKSKVYGLFIGPVAYESFLSLQAVQSMQSEGLKFHVYSGSGLGLLFATFLAAGKSVDQIEWFFFKIRKDLASLKLYSQEWVDFLVEQSMGFIQVKTVEKLSGSLVIPLYHQKTKKMHYFNKGNLQSFLKANFSIFPKGAYTGAINKSLFPTYGLKSSFSDMVICIDSLGRKLNFKDIDHFLLGLLNRLIAARQSEIANCDEVLSIDSRTEIDDISLLDRFRVIERKQIESQANYIEEKVHYEKNP